jgi:hypothetical protein
MVIEEIALNNDDYCRFECNLADLQWRRIQQETGVVSVWPQKKTEL